jgi:lantibiotic biosynthesis protein
LQFTTPYQLHPQLALRTPAKDFNRLFATGGIHILLYDAAFLEALYLASPVLHEACMKLLNGVITDDREKNKIETALTKYYQRMCGRSTPFGLFAGCGITNWTDADKPIEVNTRQPGRHTRLDMHYSCALAQHLATLPLIQERLRYYPNNSYYHTPGETRYIEYHYQQGRRVHQVTALGRTPYLEQLLQQAASGITVAQMKALLVKDEITEAEAEDYIKEVLMAQVLVSELDPAITGKEFTDQLVDTLSRINRPEEESITRMIDQLRQIQGLLLQVDEQVGNDAAVYKKIITCIEQLEVPFEENKLFQTDLVTRINEGGLHRQYQQPLHDAFTALCALNNRQRQPNLDWFKRIFNERYEGCEMPLLQVLDAETGIGYPENTGESPSALLDDLVIQPPPANSRNIEWNEMEEWLHTQLQTALHNKQYEVTLAPAELEKFAVKWGDCPPSLTAFFRVVEDGRMAIDHISGSSAAALLGRFGYGEAQLAALVNNITATENKLNPDICFAEIIHLPESRIGNILLHPVYRPYEIPYLAASSLPAEGQISPGDIMVAVKNNRIVLRSLRLQKEIIPRLSSAHNFSYNALPVYRFLCDLQTQQLRSGFNFQWGALAATARFLPRVVYKNVILNEASWRLKETEIKELLAALKNKDTHWLQQRQMPRLLSLADSDNELPLDTQNAVSIAAFEQAVKGRPFITLKELLPPAEHIVRNETGQVMAHQFAACFVKTEAVYTAAPAPAAHTQVQQQFAPGSEWLYLKMYCGKHASEEILQQHLYPAIQELMTQQQVRQWFYIRYTDPHFHLRLRLHLSDARHYGTVMHQLHQVIEPLLANRLVWKLQADTYERELERYGGPLIEAAEQLFFVDSEMKLHFLNLTEGDDRETLRWPWLFAQINWFLDRFNYGPAKKENLLKNLKEGFAAEFKTPKPVLQQMNQQYKKGQDSLNGFMRGEGSFAGAAAELCSVFEKFTPTANGLAQTIRSGCEQQRMHPDGLLGSYIHMICNRLFIDKPREHEMVLYDFLHKWYVGERQREKYKK